MSQVNASTHATGLNILMVSDVYFPRINGVSTSIQSFREQLLALGHRVTLVVPDYGTGAVDDPDLFRVAGWKVPADPEDRLFNRAALRRSLQELDDRAFDLVHVQTPFLAHYEGVQLARARGIPVIETCHTLLEEYLHHYIKIVPRALTRSVTRRITRSQTGAVDELIVPSSAVRDLLEGCGVTTPMRVLPTGLADDCFGPTHPQALAQRLGLDLGRPTLVHVGRVAHEKNIDFLLHMLVVLVGQLPRVQLLIAGEGPALGHIKSLSTRLRLQDNIRFVGYLSRGGDLQDFYACSDLFVFASRTETQGLVLLEAMACGVPVVSTAMLGTRDILLPERGALVADENEQDFAGKVLRLLGDEVLRKSLSLDARAWAAHWNAAASANKLVDIYSRLVQASAASHAGAKYRRNRGPAGPGAVRPAGRQAGGEWRVVLLELPGTLLPGVSPEPGRLRPVPDWSVARRWCRWHPGTGRWQTEPGKGQSCEGDAKCCAAKSRKNGQLGPGVWPSSCWRQARSPSVSAVPMAG
jgi:glycosyltransferase involved in cell wall biosynthesis